MSKPLSFIASIFAARALARLDRRAKASRRRKQLLNNTALDLLEERQLLSLSGLSEEQVYPLAYPGYSFAATSTVDTTTSNHKTYTDSKSLVDLEPLARYAISGSIGGIDSSYSAKPGDQAFTFFHDYSVTMNYDGVTYMKDGESWKFVPESYGYGHAQQAIASASPTASKNRVTYDTNGLDTWFVNGPIGVQQGFTVESRPKFGNPSDPLTVTVGMGGSLKAYLQSDSDGINLLRADGSKALSFSGLTAYDATGRVLGAHFEIDAASLGQKLRYVVDDAGAQYPVTIDPFTQAACLTVSGSTFLGTSAAQSADGSIVLVGAP